MTDAVLALAGELAEHLRDPEEVARWTGRFIAEVTERPGRVYARVRDMLDRQRVRLRLLPLVRRYEQRKRDLEAIDFGDQVARAARVARDHPEVGEIERARFRVVLLDEYQDTSHAQVVLLRSLFGGGHPVTAVGDPCQSIYGWRGASAGTLDRFPELFRDRGGAPAAVRELTTSWRNRAEILAVANSLAAAAAGRRGAGGHPDRRRRALGRRSVSRRWCCTLRETYLDEAAWIADRIAAAWRCPVTGDGRRDQPTQHRGAGAPPRSDPADRGGAAGPRAAGRGGGPGWAAGHPGGAGRGLHPAGARRPDRRGVAGAPAHRGAVADRAARPGGAAPPGPGAGRGAFGAPRRGAGGGAGPAG